MTGTPQQTFTVNDSEIQVTRPNHDDEESLSLAQRIWTLLSERGYSVGPDPFLEPFGSIKRMGRHGKRGGLEFVVYASGRHVSVEFFQNVANVSNPNGGRYDFNKLERMPYLLRLRARLDMAAIKTLLSAAGFDDTTPYRCASASAEVRRRNEAWRKDSPVHEYNRRDADGARLDDGVLRYYRDHKGYLRRGVVVHNINNMWWVIENEAAFCNRWSGELFTFDPQKHSARRDMSRVACDRVRSELEKAVKAENYERAAVLRDVRNAMAQASAPAVRR